MSGRTKRTNIGTSSLYAVTLADMATLGAGGDIDFRKVVEALPAAVYMTDAEGRITFYNEAAVSLWGHRPTLGESQWCGSWRLYWPDGTPMPHDQCPMALAIKENRAITGMEAVAERPDGSRVHFLPFPVPLRDAAGKLVGAMNMLVDVTERRRTEFDAMRLASIVETSDDAIVSKNLDGIITSWNRGAERLFGYSAEEAIGRPVTMLMPPERVDEEPSILARIRRGERIDHYETVRCRKDGSLIDISLTVSPIKDTNGKVIGVSKIARDIAERRRAQQQQQLLVGEIKHRIRNTLATVQGIARQTLQSTSVEEREAFIARLGALAGAHDLLTAERWNRAALHEIVDRALQAFQERLGARFLVEGPKDVWFDAQKASLLTMALHELATNAVKYGALSNGEGMVKVTWEMLSEDDSTRVRITWRETGGPIVVAPERKGFGSFLIERALQGSADLDFNPDGLVCTFEVTI